MISFFSRHISGTQSFQENRLFAFHAFVALKLLVSLSVSLIGRLVACSARTRVDKQTDRQTDETKYRNPRCACAPRVKYA